MDRSRNASSPTAEPPQASPRASFFRKVFEGSRKRARTRALILDTAIELIAEKGIERASIAEIAQRAGMSNGSFYYHFRDKEELLEAVGGAIAAIFVHEIDHAIADVSSGVERVAIASQLFVARATDTPSWGRLVVHALSEIGEFREQISRGIQQDVRIGMEQGVFTLPPIPAVYPMLLAVVGAAISQKLSDPPANADAGMLAAQIILRALGVSDAEASEVTQRVREELDRFTHEDGLDVQEVIGDFST